MSFNTFVIACCDRFVSQRTFELVVAPALADLEFEEREGRRGAIDNRIAVLRAVVGAVCHDARRGSDGFLKLMLLSACYYAFPVAVSVRMFNSWSEFFLAMLVVLAMSLTPVMVCFWPSRDPVRHGE